MAASAKKTPPKKSSAVRDITIKRVKQEDNFRVHHIEDSPSVEPLMERRTLETPAVEEETDFFEDPEVEEVLEEASRTEQIAADPEPRDFVNVKFSKFVQLITSRDCSEVVNGNPDEILVMSSNLLTELAGTHDDKEEKKIPLVLLVGIAIGVVIAYFLFAK